jgi:orotidine-5'-phosphate decarboxylase
MTRNFRDMLESRWADGTLVCVGLDSTLDLIPEFAHRPTSSSVQKIAEFNRAIIEATHDLVCAYKLNLGPYIEHVDRGLAALRDTVDDIYRIAPRVPVILDAKFSGDIPHTVAGYVALAFQHLRMDAVTVIPYLGMGALQPFLDYREKGIFVICRSSHQGADEFQDLDVHATLDEAKILNDAGSMCGMNAISGFNTPLYNRVAFQVQNHWNANGNCGLVVGATRPYELRGVRAVVGHMPILIPGIGEQGGDLKQAVLAGADNAKKGMIINASRSIIFASRGMDFADAARRATLELRGLINQHLDASVEVAQ